MQRCCRRSSRPRQRAQVRQCQQSPAVVDQAGGALLAEYGGDLEVEQFRCCQILSAQTGPCGVAVPAVVTRAECGSKMRCLDRCAVVRMFVSPAGQGAGLGEALLTAAWQAATVPGRAPVLDVVSTNRSSLRLYERLGWTRLGSFEQAFRDGRPLGGPSLFRGPVVTATSPRWQPIDPAAPLHLC